jgi:hypothetical protein
MTVTTPSEPAVKLDTPPHAAVLNGPEGELVDWHAIDWRAVKDDV